MAYPQQEHEVIKPQKIVDGAVGILENELVLPKMISVSGIDQFKGAQGDTITQRLPGRLPGRIYEFRSKLRPEIVLDVYKEGKVDITMGGHAYSGTGLTDEQAEFDMLGDFGVLLEAQSQAVARVLNEAAVNLVKNAKYAVTIGGAEQDFRGALIEARRILNAFGVPKEQRWLAVGSDFEAAMLNDDRLTFANVVGDNRADNALTNATLGTLYGFRVVADNTLAPSEAYAFVGSGFKLLTAAPAIPRSVNFGATKNYKGFGLRWMRDYDVMRFMDRSVVDAWYGTGIVEDVLYPVKNKAFLDAADADTPFDPDNLPKAFLRGIKLNVGGASDYSGITAAITAETGVTNTAWTPKIAA